MLYKVQPNSIKDIDRTKRLIKIALNCYSVVDAGRDIVMPGAFSKTIMENGPKGKNRIKHMKNHDWRMVPGVFSEIYDETSDGKQYLVGITKLANTQLGNDTLIEYEEGIITEHSIGYDVVKEERDEAQNTNRLLELKLWEGSSLTAWGMNEHTPYLGAKTLEELLRMGDIGAFSDERLKAIEEAINNLKEKFDTLVKSMEPPPSTPNLAEPFKSLLTEIRAIK